MKTILLLGGYGFIGTNLIKWAENKNLNYRFIVFDRFVNHPLGVTADNIIKSYDGDFADRKLIEKIFNENNIDLVIHSLSNTIPLQMGSSIYDVESNLIPTINLLEVMHQYNTQDIIYISSGGAIYGDTRQKNANLENEDVKPKSSYGVIKLAIEKYLFLYKETYQLRPLILRLSNPYGRYHTSTKQGIINVALKAAQNKKTFTVWGDGTATKDYIFVEDLCEILYALYEQKIHGEVINVASGELLSVNTILNEIKSKYPTFQWNYVDANSNDVQYVALNTQKLNAYIRVNYTKFYDVIKRL